MMKRLLQALVILPLLAGVAAAQWPTDPTVNLPVCTATGDQDDLQGMNSAQQGMLMGWLDQRSGSVSLYAQRLTKDGDVVWETNGKFITDDVSAFSMMPSAEGRTYVAWSSNGVYVQLLDENGDPMWTSPVSLFGGRPMTDGPFVLSYGPLGVLVVAAQIQAGLGSYFWAAKLDTNGNVLWTSLQSETQTAANLRVINDLSGGAFIAYDLEHATIKLNRVNGSGFWGFGAPTGFEVTTSPCSPKYLSWLLPDGAGGAYLTWSQRDSASGCQGPYDHLDVWAQRIAGDTTRVWSDSGAVVCKLEGDQTQSKLMVNSGHKTFVVWTDYGHGSPGATESDIYMQMLDSSGTAILTPGGVPVCTAPGDQKNPTVILDGQGGLIVAWQDYRNGNWDIFAQRFDTSGTALWTPDGVPLSTAAGDQTDPTLALVDNGSAICAWVDGRKGSETDIYAQRVFPDGSLPVVFTTFSASTSSNAVDLRWRVNPLLDYRGFEVWRSDNQNEVFRRIAHLGAGGTADREYHFTDENVEANATYQYRVEALLADGTREVSQTLSVTLQQDSSEPTTVPVETKLVGAYPNPFRKTTRISFQIGVPGEIELSIFDITGREIRRFSLTNVQA
ncbi:MAG: hypothetical protein GXO73_11720, partial [Calditrichaeota bacterium]|nr:hypothetical protein [Calditrichota bacterium]